ncbi:MAG: hypothetical protein Q9160_006278 [Pyrenula sp. 1 TL-2023]
MSKSMIEYTESKNESTIAKAQQDVEAPGAVPTERALFNPQPSDDPADPLNWPMTLKVECREMNKKENADESGRSAPASLLVGSTRYPQHGHHQSRIRINGQGIQYYQSQGIIPDCRSGRAMGFYTVMMTNGGHVCPIIGGLLGQYCGWRWIFKFAAILDGVMLLVIFFCLPETLYVRSVATETTEKTSTAPEFSKSNVANRLRLWSDHPELKLKPSYFILPSIKMAAYPSVLFPALYYASQYGFASILPAVTVASIFEEFFGWDTLQIGLGYGAALTIGGCLGEVL